ncbi:MAG: 2Fe-2S iron-sulfur cluster-binding protein [Gemmataceae bacterium]
MKTLTFAPINEKAEVATRSHLLEALLSKDLKVMTACGGKGLCATCHVHIDKGAENLTPMTDREKRTLSMITGSGTRSRLACQARVLGEGVVVQLPEGMYIERAEDLMSLLGKRAEANILHPINGSVLIAKGKIITRGRLDELKNLQVEVTEIKAKDV